MPFSPHASLARNPLDLGLVLERTGLRGPDNGADPRHSALPWTPLDRSPLPAVDSLELARDFSATQARRLELPDGTPIIVEIGRHRLGRALLWRIAIGDLTTVFAGFLSEQPDDRSLLTVAERPRVNAAEDVRANVFIGASLDVLWNSHQGKLSSSETPPIESLEDAWHLVEHLVALGGYHAGSESPQSEGEPADLSQLNLSILEQIRKTHRKQTGSIPTAIMIGVMIVSLEKLGVFQWSGTFFAMLAGVILLHELGHWLAMQVFGYREHRLFMIPAFSRTKRRRGFVAPGWKKALVALAGPVPGVLLAIGLTVLSAFQPHPQLLPAISLLCLVNGINLLPIRQVDGGWVAQTLLFCRAAWLQAANKAVGGIVAVLFGLSSGMWLLAGFGLLILVGLPMTYRVDGAAMKLRKQGLAPTDDDDTINDELGQRIVSETLAICPGVTNVSSLGTFGSQMFDSLIARPTGWVSTILIGTLYVASLLAALFTPFIATAVAMGPNFGMGGGFGGKEFTGTASCNDIRKWPAANGPQVLTDYVLGDYPSADQLEKWMNARPWEPGFSRITIGKTLIVCASRDHAQALDALVLEMRLGGGDAGRFRSMWMKWSLEAPDEATARQVHDELRVLALSPAQQWNLIPPWSGRHKITPEQFRARKFCLAYVDAGRHATEADQECQRINGELTRVYDQLEDEEEELPPDRAAEVERLRTALDNRETAVRQRSHEEFLRQHLDPVDQRLAELARSAILVGWGSKRPADEVERDFLALTELLGRVPGNPTELSIDDQRELARGEIALNGRSLELSFWSFRAPTAGIPLLADYLCGKGFVPGEYTVSGMIPALLQD